jgi:hypothetical protein
MISNAAKSAESISEIRTGIATEIRVLARGQGSVSQTQMPLAFILAISRGLTRLVSLEDEFQCCKERRIDF